MSRHSRITASFVVTGLLSTLVSTSAFAGGPLLSGYGGPGAGEQAIVGSTLLNGPSGGSGSGGSSGSPGGSGSGQGSVGGASAGSGPVPASTHGAQAGLTGGVSSSRGNAGSRAPQAARHARTGAAADSVGGMGASAFVYPSSLRSASTSSPALGISGGDLLVLLLAIAALALVGALTMRVSRLQR
jgi:hypothetical protein